MGVSGDLQKLFVEKTQTQKVLTTETATSAVTEVTINFLTLLQEVGIVVRGRNGKQVGKMGLLDEGSKVIANSRKEELEGCIKGLGIWVSGVLTFVHAFVVKTVPYRLLLERPLGACYAELIAIHACALERCDEDLAHIHERILAAHYTSIHDFEKWYVNQIHDYDFPPGTLILILNKKIESDMGRKYCSQYFGPMIVAKQLHSRVYLLVEVNRAMSKLKFAAFRLIPYYSQS
ncbi:hypothetical protein AN958_02929 [Leucoagaricus sp. SymC.cos]|nr:hypothetical protein AN958_02929 [Leucoagaricus sp. SymC.cos]